MKKFEFSKFIMDLAAFAYYVVIAVGVWVTVKCVQAEDYASASMVILGLGGVVGTVTGVAYGFYSNKAKSENLIKIAKQLDREDIEDVATLANSVGGLQ